MREKNFEIITNKDEIDVEVLAIVGIRPNGILLGSTIDRIISGQGA
jgi:hypothetical protein